METELLFHGVEQCSRSEMDQMDRISRLLKRDLLFIGQRGIVGMDY